MPCNCSVKFCKNRLGKNGKKSFYRFPNDESIAKEWLKVCRDGTANLKNGK